ncbi:MAG: ABC transporter ATP-binding protein [Aggregatilineales bacterium]
MIEINHLSKHFKGGIHALDDITLNIGTGMFGLIGPNGAGKTTLMRIIAGLLRPTSGEISVSGNDITQADGKRAMKTMLGYLPQELGLYPNLTAREFLDYIAILKGITDSASRKKQIDDLLAMVRLEDAGKRRLKAFSGGMKRRVGIAQALIGTPKLIIVDEPTAGLDPEERVRFRNILSDIATRCTVILSTHIIEDISQSCNDLAVMNHGKVIFRGAPRELIQQAQNHVWGIISTGERLPQEVTIVSTLQVAEGVQYRILGDPPAHLNAQPLQPSLEDGYMWLMKQRQIESVG